tara:strand:+ start:817 stop:1731 length:915 start_codon:yes stop_codon:yes gene_type:complete
MALGVSAFSEAAFSTEPNDVVAFATGISLTFSTGEESNVGNANVDVTGIQATLTNAGAVGGTSVQVSVTGSQLASSIGEEDIDVGVPITGIELSITNKTSTQDTLNAFGESPFATLSASTFNIPSVEVEATTGGGTLPSFLLQSTLGTFSVQAGANISVVVTEHTINSSVGDVSITGLANVSVTGTQMAMSLGSEDASADFTAVVTGQQLTTSIGDESITADANVTLSGISLTSSIGTAEQSSTYPVTGISMTMSMGEETPTGNANVTPTGIQLQSNTGNPNITAWAEIDPGVANVWTEVDLAA